MKHKDKNKNDLAIEDLWFVDYKVVKPAPRWVRAPFMTQDEVSNSIGTIIFYNKMYNNLSEKLTDEKIFQKYPFIEVTREIRVQSEKYLDEVIDGLTLRERVFGRHYQFAVDGVKSGEWTLTELREDIERGRNLN